MLKSILLISGLILMSFSVHATLNQSTWRPGIRDGCGARKFKCPALKVGKNKCRRKPKRYKCEVIKLNTRKTKVTYEDFCAKLGYVCGGGYKSCKDGPYSVSVGGTRNPYAACDPK